MRYAAVVVMFGLVLATAFLPTVEAAEPGDQPGLEAPPVAICPIVEVGDRRSRVSVLSSVDGQGRLSSFSAGSETGVVEFRTGTSGAVTIPGAETGAVGPAGGLVEMPSETTAAGVIVSGPESWAAEACADIPTGQAFISGGSTISDSFFEVQLINPYAGEATVGLTVATETGLESDARFDAVIVPALSTITLDLTQIIPGRESISVNIETTRGSVLTFGRQTTNGEVALWRAVEPAQEWWLPVPPGGGTKQMRIATAEASQVEYQVDLYGPDGLVEEHDAGVIDARGSVTVPLAAISEQAIGVKVITTAPVVPALKIDSPQGLAWTTASPVEAPVWLLPGARSPSGGSGSIVVLNSGIEPVDVSVTSLAQTTQSQDLKLAAESIVVVDLVAANGYRVESSGPVTALWVAQIDGAGSAAFGIPLQDE